MTERPNEQTIEELLRDGILHKEDLQFAQATADFTQAMLDAQKIGYHHGALHALLNLGSIWKLQFRQTQATAFARMAQSFFAGARAYAQEHKMPQEELVHATFLLGQAEFELKNYTQAVVYYQEAADFYTQNPRSQAHLGDVKRHLGLALVFSGKREEGIFEINAGLLKIRTFDEKDAFDKRNFVWETGALLALAFVYKDDDKKQARTFAQEALEIAQRENLIIRVQEAQQVLSLL